MIHLPLSHRPVFWDALIALLCAGLLLIIVAASLLPSPFSWITGIAAGIGLAIILYGSFIEPKRIIVNTKSIRKDLPALRIAVIGDLHVGPYKQSAFVEKIVHDVNALEPDLIFLAGDFLFDHTSDITHLDPLRGLRAAHGVFGILGNHDAGEHLHHGKHCVTVDRSGEVTEYLQNRGIMMLRNASQPIVINGKTFHVAGIDDIWMQSSDLQKTLNDIPEHEVVLLLAHNPDTILDTRSHRASLIVSGHTHGGQIRLPLIGSIPPIPTKLGKRYDQGLFMITDRTTLAITHGIGETQTRARLFCTPEILVLMIES